MLNLNFDAFPVLETENLILRQVSNDDVNEIFTLRSDPRVMQYIDRPLAETLDDAFKLIQVMNDCLKEETGITWGITLKNDNKLIGTIGLWRIVKEHYRGEIGYLISPDYWRKGLTNEAMKAVINFGFEKIGLHSIEGVVNPDNEASIKLLEKNKFVREAYYKENYFFNGKFLDTGVYSLLNPNT